MNISIGTAQFSRYLDEKIGERLATMGPDELRAELLLLHRTIKIAEELGEAVQRLIGLTGANPRKGVEMGAREAIVQELCDVILSAGGALEHITGNNATMEFHVEMRLRYVLERSGLVTRTEQ